MPDTITYTTDDGVLIVGDWTPAPTMIGVALLLHMMPETRRSWSAFERALVARSIGSLAIDLRGHGESTNMEDGDTVDYREFEDADHQSSAIDVVVALNWIRKRGIELNRIVVVGASIGANLGIQLLAEYPLLAGVIALSPGEDYHGVRALDDAQNLNPEQALFIAASENDPQSFVESKKLYDLSPTDRKVFVPCTNAGHGTHMFNANPQLMEKAADWIVEVFKG